MRVLIVDDEAPLRDLLADALRQRGHTVSAVADAESALALYREHPFPMVIADWVLPGLSGLELTRIIRGLPRGRDAFILAATARDKTEDLHAALGAGADDYIAKPLHRDALSTRIAVAEKAIARRQLARQAELELLASEHRFAAIFRRHPAAIALVRKRDQILVDANDAYWRLFGASRDASAGGGSGGPRTTLPPALRERLMTLTAEGTASKMDNEPVTLVRLAPDGDKKARALISVESVDVDGDDCWLVTMSDVTERERLREQLLLGDRMVSMGTLVTGVAHEINNPLHSILTNLGYVSEEAEALATRLPDAAAQTQLCAIVEAIDEARLSAERVRTIVLELKTFSRMDEQPRPVDVHDVLESAVKLVRKEIEQRARLERRFAEISPVHGNAGRLIQVFVNLLTNAALAIPVGHVADHCISLRTAPTSSGHITVSVCDTGCGIAPDQLTRVFDPFFTTRPVGEGSGLGLGICHAIISSMEGRIDIESEVGRGTIVHVTLPVAGERLAQTPEHLTGPEVVTSPVRRGRILVIDDELMIGKSLRRALSNEHDVEIVTDARQGLAALQSSSFDLILCDLMMPDMTGMELHGTLETEHVSYLDKIVFLTGGAFIAGAKEFLDKVGRVCLEKPIDVSRLRKLIRSRL